MRIFVSLGTHPQQFNRILKELDSLLASKKIRAAVFAQTGNSDFEPKNFSFKRFISSAAMASEIAKADIVVSHGGAGSIIDALSQKKPLVIVPRLKAFGEHTNDHQLDLAKAMEREGKAIAVLDMKRLGSAIKKAASFKPKQSEGSARMVAAINSFLKKEGLLA
jgi:UDP-N-acetylglucosamine transferase subunit ALG13